MNAEEIKKSISERAIDECVKDDMLIGIGTGSTIKFAIDYLAGKLEREELKGVRLVPTSIESELLCQEKNMPIVSEWDQSLNSRKLDLTIDGADKVTDEGFIIKGMGGAAVREKIIAYNSAKLVILVDESKLADNISGFIPLEILPFAYRFCERKLIEMGIEPKRRKASNGKDGVLISDNGNFIVDGYLSSSILDKEDPEGKKKLMDDPEKLERLLNMIPGIVDSGIFYHKNQTVYVGYEKGDIKKIDFESLKPQ